MQPEYGELYAIIGSQRKEIEELRGGNRDLRAEDRKLKEEVEELQKAVAEIADGMKRIQDENRKLINGLGKYVNENTPSGAIPPYTKKKLEGTFERHSKASEGDNPEHKENGRNTRPKHIGREEYNPDENRVAPDAGGRNAKGNIHQEKDRDTLSTSRVRECPA